MIILAILLLTQDKPNFLNKAPAEEPPKVAQAAPARPENCKDVLGRTVACNPY